MAKSKDSDPPVAEKAKLAETPTLASVFAPVKVDLTKMKIHGYVANGVCFVQCAATGHSSSFRVKGNELLVSEIAKLTKETAKWKNKQVKSRRQKKSPQQAE